MSLAAKRVCDVLLKNGFICSKYRDCIRQMAYCLTMEEIRVNCYYLPSGLLHAIKGYWLSLEFVPDNKKTAKRCLAAVKWHGMQMEYVPDDKKTPELCLIAVSKCGYALQFVPDSKKTPEICLAAVKQDALGLQFVPDSMKTHEIIAAGAVPKY